jgi:hypothetical protein
VKQHENEKDGNAAWKLLCEWYDGDVIKNEMAKSLCSCIEGLKLHTGTTARKYVNKYLMYYHNFAKIPGEGVSSSHGTYLFLRNISNPDLPPIVLFLWNTSPDSMGCVAVVREAERDLLQKEQESHKFRQTLRPMKSEGHIVSGK